MTWQEAIDKLGWHWNQRILWLCSEDNPDENTREGYRRNVIELANPDSRSAQFNIQPTLATTVVVGPGGSIQPIDDFTSLASSAAPAANKIGGGCGCGGSQPVPQSRPPGLATQAVTAARAGLRWAAGGFRFASPEVQANRRAICDACEHHETRQDQCNICKCFLKQKIKLPQEACPISKWVAINSDPSSVSPALPSIPPP